MDHLTYTLVATTANGEGEEEEREKKIVGKRNDPTSQITTTFILVLYNVISSHVLRNTVSLSSHSSFVIAQYLRGASPES